ncbi:BEN domain-containing protein 6-like protein [Camelus ferus]|nr:BEN domain-containing protein 6-like protein [Camelus ferus]
MQKILQTEEITNTQALRKGKRKRTETMDSENANSGVDKGQRDPYSGNAFLPGESSSEDEQPLAELSKEELCTKVKSLKQKLTNTRKENSRLRQSLVMLQVLPQAVTQFEELVGMAEALLKGGGTLTTAASTLWRATNNSSPDSFASTCSNSNSNSSSPISLKAEEEHHADEKQIIESVPPAGPEASESPADENEDDIQFVSVVQAPESKAHSVVTLTLDLVGGPAASLAVSTETGAIIESVPPAGPEASESPADENEDDIQFVSEGPLRPVLEYIDLVSSDDEEPSTSRSDDGPEDVVSGSFALELYSQFCYSTLSEDVKGLRDTGKF